MPHLPERTGLRIQQLARLTRKAGILHTRDVALEQAAPHGLVPPRAFALELHSAASADTTASESVDLFNQSAGSGRRDFLEPSGGTVIDKGATTTG